MDRLAREIISSFFVIDIIFQMLYIVSIIKQRGCNMKNSYASEELIQEVLNDIAVFGEDFNVYAIYSYFERVDGRWIDEEFITDYVHADKPTREEIGAAPWLEEDEEEYQQLLADYKASMKSLEQTKHKKMTLQELLQKLEEQDRIF